MTDTKRRRRALATVEPAPIVTVDHAPDETVQNALAEQHPVYGAFGYAFVQMGGRDALAEWAEDNPTDFYRIFSRMVPKEGGGASQINIQVNANLGPTPLDE